MMFPSVDFTCPRCHEDFSGLEALDHLDEEIERVTSLIDHEIRRKSDNMLYCQMLMNTLTVLLAKRHILDKKVSEREVSACLEVGEQWNE